MNNNERSSTDVRQGIYPIAATLSDHARSQMKVISKLDNCAEANSELRRITLRAVVDTVGDHIKNGELWSLNELLDQVQPSDLRKITSIAFLRTSFRVRDKLSNWASLYVKTRIHLKETGQDADRALRGLSRKKIV